MNKQPLSKTKTQLLRQVSPLATTLPPMGKTVVTVDPTADSLADTQIRPMPITSIGQMLQREQFIFEAEPLDSTFPIWRGL